MGCCTQGVSDEDYHKIGNIARNTLSSKSNVESNADDILMAIHQGKQVAVQRIILNFKANSLDPSEAGGSDAVNTYCVLQHIENG